MRKNYSRQSATLFIFAPGFGHFIFALRAAAAAAQRAHKIFTMLTRSPRREEVVWTRILAQLLWSAKLPKLCVVLWQEIASQAFCGEKLCHHRGGGHRTVIHLKTSQGTHILNRLCVCAWYAAPHWFSSLQLVQLCCTGTIPSFVETIPRSNC